MHIVEFAGRLVKPASTSRKASGLTLQYMCKTVQIETSEGEGGQETFKQHSFYLKMKIIHCVHSLLKLKYPKNELCYSLLHAKVRNHKPT